MLARVSDDGVTEYDSEEAANLDRLLLGREKLERLGFKMLRELSEDARLYSHEESGRLAIMVVYGVEEGFDVFVQADPDDRGIRGLHDALTRYITPTKEE
jgi:negative regulator of genetic competence, sporulation and motility